MGGIPRLAQCCIEILCLTKYIANFILSTYAHNSPVILLQFSRCRI